MKPVFGILTIISFVLFTTLLKAQPYNTGIGLRLGGLTSGLNVKHFMNNEGSSLEGIASFGHHNFLLTGLYEKNNGITNAEGLMWYFGGGAHVGFWGYNGRYL